MLKNIFLEFLYGKEVFCLLYIWEFSCFVINFGQKGLLGFFDCMLEVMCVLVCYSLQNDIQMLVMVIIVGVEKMMICVGLDVLCFGLYLKIGIECVVVLCIEFNVKIQIVFYGGVLVEQ